MRISCNSDPNKLIINIATEAIPSRLNPIIAVTEPWNPKYAIRAVSVKTNITPITGFSSKLVFIESRD